MVDKGIGMTFNEMLNIGLMQGFAGLSLFSVLLLMGLGLAVIFGQMGVINMAHGELMMIGAYTVFLGSTLLLFANAFAAYATAAALISQGNLILPLLIRSALTSEVVLGQTGMAYALALEMIVVVGAVMFGYTGLVRRTARWLS